MRKTTVIPIGQGCKCTKATGYTSAQLGAMRCTEHFWLYINICLNCGDRFHTDRPHTKTCSSRCRMARSRSLRFDKTFQLVMKFAEGVA